MFFFARRPCGFAAVLILYCKISDKGLLFIKINFQNQNWSGAEFRTLSYSFAHALLLLALPLNPLPILINHKVAERHEYEIEEVNVAPDHVHIFLSFLPRYSIAHVVGVLKSISAAEVFEKFPEMKKELWRGEFWEDGYFARTVGDKVTADLIKRYIKYHRDGTHGSQLKLF